MPPREKFLRAGRSRRSRVPALDWCERGIVLNWTS